MDIQNIVDMIEKIKGEEYENFGSTKTDDMDMLLIQHSEFFGFQRACDRIIHDIKQN
jgi:hypothetical protein